MPRRQRGAAAVFAAIAMIFAVVAMLLGINIGMLYYAQRELQKQAVLAAMAGVQVAVGCRAESSAGGTPGTLDAVTARVMQALGDNAGTSDLLSKIGNQPPVELGKIVNSSGLYTFVDLPFGNTQIDAVRVNLSRKSPTVLGSGFFPGASPVTLMASATASEQPLGGFDIGSTLVSLNTSQSLLNPLFSALVGSSVNLSAVDYQNLASTQISLASLMVAAGVDDLNSLLSLYSNAPVPQLQALLVTATNTVNPSAANLIQGLTLGKYQQSQTVPLANLLGSVGAGLNPAVRDAAALAPTLHLMDLLTQLGETAAAIDPSHFLQLQALPSIPGLLNTYVFLSVQEPMQHGFGPVGAPAQTTQIVLHVRANVDTSGLNTIFNLLKTLTLGLASFNAQPINLGLDLAVAKATGTLDSLMCPTALIPNPSARVAVNSHVATLTLGTFSGIPQANTDLQGGNLLSIKGTSLLGTTLLDFTSAINNTVSTTLGSTTGAEAGYFKIYGVPASLPSPTQPRNYNYAACNSLGTNPLSCGDTTDPNNPAAPIPSGDIASGISYLVGQLVAKNNLSVVAKSLGVTLDVSAILDPLVSALNTLVITPLTGLANTVLNLLLPALGLQLGSATVLMNNVVTGPAVLVNVCLPLPLPPDKDTPPPPRACQAIGG